ncbi:hypothetical protein EfmAA242_06660 [Enterococcus faecium]|nr:hypothetical protein EfmAA242_06660 [Enterococcus faecium]
MSNDIQPEIRFPGFTEAWEQRKFECLLDKKDGVRRGPFGSALKKEFFVSNSNFVVYEQQNANFIGVVMLILKKDSRVETFNWLLENLDLYPTHFRKLKEESKVLLTLLNQ